MAAEITIPSVGVAMESAILLAWLKQEGDIVEAGEVVAEIETDKSTLELSAPASGRLGPHLYEEGAEVPVGAAVIAVFAAGESPAAPQETGFEESESPRVDGQRDPAAASGDAAVDERSPRRDSPRARRLAAEAANAPSSGQAGEPAPSGRFRELIAKRVGESWREIPHFTVERELEVEALIDALARVRVREEAVTLTDLLLRAQALAVAAAEPSDLGLAVASEHGVMIPVVRDVLRRTLPDLVAARAAAVDRGRAGRLTADDGELPSSTLSNLGPFGVDSFTGIIAAGQTTLFTVGAIRRAAVVRDDALVPSSVMVVTVNADHRALDGADAARALARFADAVENPEKITVDGALQ